MLRGIIFDMDGTITKPNVDFAAIERKLALRLDSLLIMPRNQVPEERARALEILERYESKAAIESELNEGGA